MENKERKVRDFEATFSELVINWRNEFTCGKVTKGSGFSLFFPGEADEGEVEELCSVLGLTLISSNKPGNSFISDLGPHYLVFEAEKAFQPKKDGEHSKSEDRNSKAKMSRWADKLDSLLQSSEWTPVRYASQDAKGRIGAADKGLEMLAKRRAEAGRREPFYSTVHVSFHVDHGRGCSTGMPIQELYKKEALSYEELAHLARTIIEKTNGAFEPEVKIKEQDFQSLPGMGVIKLDVSFKASDSVVSESEAGNQRTSMEAFLKSEGWSSDGQKCIREALRAVRARDEGMELGKEMNTPTAERQRAKI